MCPAFVRCMSGVCPTYVRRTVKVGRNAGPSAGRYRRVNNTLPIYLNSSAAQISIHALRPRRINMVNVLAERLRANRLNDHCCSRIYSMSRNISAVDCVVVLLQALTRESPSLRHRIISHFNSLWNIFDFVMFALFLVAVILRLTLKSDHVDWTRMAYAFDLTMFSVRFLQAFFVEKSMGPLVIIIKGMVRFDIGPILRLIEHTHVLPLNKTQIC